MRHAAAPEPPITLRALLGAAEALDALHPALAEWVVVPPEWIQFHPYEDTMESRLAPIGARDARRGLEFVLRAFDEEGWALGHRGWIVMKHAEIIGREIREREEEQS